MSVFPTLGHFTSDLDALAKRLTGEEPEELRLVRMGMLANQPGSFGQYFGAWDIAAGMVRDYAMYALYPLLRIARAGRDGADLALLMDELVAPYTSYLGYSGFAPLERYADELRRLSRGATTREIEPALSAYLKYVNRLCAWLYHYFPWGLGEKFRYPEAQDTEASNRPPVVDSLKPSQTFIRLSWEPLGVSVRAWLAVDQNPELCNDLLEALPFRVLQDHPIVSGESIFAWTPFISTAPVRVRETISDGPVGRLRFSQRTGQKLIVQYGETIETIQSPVLGSVHKADIRHLADVGRAVWESTYRTKDLIWLRVEKS